jgi:hypothetical protein
MGVADAGTFCVFGQCLKAAFEVDKSAEYAAFKASGFRFKRLTFFIRRLCSCTARQFRLEFISLIFENVDLIFLFGQRLAADFEVGFEVFFLWCVWRSFPRPAPAGPFCRLLWPLQ